MEGQLMFEGQEVVEVVCRVSGSLGDARLNEPLEPGDKVVIVAEVIVKKVGHDVTDEGLVRLHVMKVVDGFVTTGVDADDLIQRLRAERQQALDELLGTPPLPMGDDQEEQEEP